MKTIYSQNSLYYSDDPLKYNMATPGGRGWLRSLAVVYRGDHYRLAEPADSTKVNCVGNLSRSAGQPAAAKLRQLCAPGNLRFCNLTTQIGHQPKLSREIISYCDVSHPFPHGAALAGTTRSTSPRMAATSAVKASLIGARHRRTMNPISGHHCARSV